MTVTEQIIERVKALPEVVQAEVLDFVEFLEAKINNNNTPWSSFSLSQAMRGMESESTQYSLKDVKDRLS
ncbi:MAG: DUF2281 domain-containing protein [Sedimentisphaerales bacterium]|nr:DUF2281 domain-containing protein [Sedimentisphaerales bacterium]